MVQRRRPAGPVSDGANDRGAVSGTPAAAAAAAAAAEPKPFVLCLYSLVSDPSSDSVICWDERPTDDSNGGTPFTILDNSRLQSEVIPRYFKHANFLSFVRQLNHYAFVKLSKKAWTFGHPHFVRDRPDLLARIERKQKKRKPRAGAQASTVAGDPRQQALRAELTAELARLRKQQDSMLTMMATLRREVDSMQESRARTEKRMIHVMETIGMSPQDARLITEEVQKPETPPGVTWAADIARTSAANSSKRRKVGNQSGADWAAVCRAESPGHTWSTVCGDEAESLGDSVCKTADVARDVAAAAASAAPANNLNTMFRSVDSVESTASRVSSASTTTAVDSVSASSAVDCANIKVKVEHVPNSWDEMPAFDAQVMVDEEFKYGPLTAFDVQSWMDESLLAQCR